MNKYFSLLIGLIILSSCVSALACVGLGGGGYTVLTAKEQPSFITYTVFNNDSENTCDAGKYFLELSIDNEDIQKVFDYKISDEDFVLKDGESKRVLITIIPKLKSGEYTVRVSALRKGLINAKDATTVMPKTVSSFKLNIVEDSNLVFQELPQWYLYKKEQQKNLIIKIILYSVIGIIILALIIYLALRFKSKFFNGFKYK